MNLLFGLFAVSAAAVVFPFVFHLIRRTPKNHQEFSSLMFLEATPPRLTRKSRLDDILLLLLRGLVLLALALAFSRPFFRTDGLLDLDDVRGRQIVIALDTSASMRTESVWESALAEVDKVLDTLEPADDVALTTFDDDLTSLVPLGRTDGEELAAKVSLVRKQLADVEPGWFATKLDTALMGSVEMFGEVEDAVASARQVIVVSDMQDGATRDGLQSYEWPEQTFVEFRKVGGDAFTSATLLRVMPEQDEAETEATKVRVLNAASSDRDRFTVRWGGATSDAEESVDFVVAPGSSRVLELPKQASAHDRLLLSGDDIAFDNAHFVTSPPPVQVAIHYIGSDAVDDPEGLLFYLQRAFQPREDRIVEITTAVERLAGNRPNLLVVSAELTDAAASVVRDQIAQGGRAVFVLTSDKMVNSVAELIGGSVVASEGSGAEGPQDRILGEIDFSDRLFAPFADPRFNDFTDIRFWNAANVEIDEQESTQIVARFDDGGPAIWRRAIGDGELLVFGSGWDPSSSQLALSNKFVPLLETILKDAMPAPLRTKGYIVGERVDLTDTVQGNEVSITRPDGEVVKLGAGNQVFAATDLPGIYNVSDGTATTSFAVNVAPDESRLEPIGIELLEQFGVAVGVQSTQAEELEAQRSLKDRELEQQQKIWKWLLLVALALLAAEMGLSGYRVRSIARASSSPSTASRTTSSRQGVPA